MKYIEKHPMTMIVIGILGISLSSILVKYSTAPSTVTAAFRLLWTVLLLTPITLGKQKFRQELKTLQKKTLVLSCLSGIFLAIHFALWFESLQHTSVTSSTTIVCTEVIWVSLGFWLFLKGKLSGKAMAAIAVALAGSILVAWADSHTGAQLYGDILSLFAAIAVAAYTLLGKVIRSRLSTTVYTWLVYTSCALTLVIICAAQSFPLWGYGLNPLVVGLVLAVFSTLLGHSVFSWCLKYFSPSFVSASKLCEPVVAAGFAAILFGEFPAPVQLLGSALILGGVFWFSRLE